MYKSVLASLAVEDLKPSKEAQEWTKMFLKGEISGDEVRYRIYKKYKIVLED
jgi:hypothetical protein